MKINFLKQIAKENPALARLIELSILSCFVYMIWALITWELLSLQTLLQASAVPLLAYLNKIKRDIEKDLNK